MAMQHLSSSLPLRMLHSMLLLILLLQYSAADVVTRLSVSYTDVVKLKCDALPYRTLYLETKCYFVIDAEKDVPATSKQCAITLNGANFTQPKDVPDSVWTTLFVDKIVFLSDSHSKGKKKAMCTFENRAFAPAGYEKSIARETLTRGITKLEARISADFYARFPEKLAPGQIIILKGVFAANVDQFTINFMTAAMEAIGFHFNIRFNSGAVYMSSAGGWINSNTADWGPGEIKANPFRKGEPFDIRFKLHENHFQILVNKMDYYNYKYRTGFDKMTHLGAGGAGYFTYVQLGENYNPAPYSPTMTIESDDKTSDGEQNTTTRWAIPYIAPLSKLETGQTIRVKGLFFEDCDQGVINFQTKNMEIIAFHFNIRFYSGIIMMGTAPNWLNANTANWGPGETKGIPFKRGEPFDILFRIHDGHFQINVNGIPFYDYGYKVPLSTITHIAIGGSGYLTLVETAEKYTQAPIEMPGFPVCGRPSCAAQGEMFSSRVQVSDCKTLFVSGYFANNFWIKLYRKNGETALYLNARFDQMAVAFNTWKNGNWGPEEWVRKFPFKRDVPFTLSITNEARGFQIFVNGTYFTTYAHRTCSYDISIIETIGVCNVAIQI